MTQTRETIVILDYGSQYTQLIARRVRELQVYCHVYPWNVDPAEVRAHQRINGVRPMGLILSGGAEQRL
jgi:GMP synthase (glutamine-hydrolysing)